MTLIEVMNIASLEIQGCPSNQIADVIEKPIEKVKEAQETEMYQNTRAIMYNGMIEYIAHKLGAEIIPNLQPETRNRTNLEE